MGATATVRVMLEVPVEQGWGDDCTMGQVRQQAAKAATDTLRKHLELTKIKVLEVYPVSVIVGER